MTTMELSRQQVDQFISEGFVRIDDAFSRADADTCCELLWRATGYKPDDPTTWKSPVLRIDSPADGSFSRAANTPILHRAYDQLVGSDRWIPRANPGAFVIRFPSVERATDTGWHVDASFAGNNPADYLDWRINIQSRGRALLMLFLFSHVSDYDAPTVIRIGSHQEVARLLAPAGEEGLSFMELANCLSSLPARENVLATGGPGTVYLCHPFLAHAAQDHQGTRPRFMAQPPLLPRTPFNIQQPLEHCCPVEQAIVEALPGDKEKTT